MRRVLIVSIALLSAAGVLLAVQPASQSDASVNVTAACTQVASSDYSCNKALVVGDHVFLDNLGRTCHANVTVAGVGTATLQIAHNVDRCPWPTGTLRSITYAIGSGAVGGIAEFGGVAETGPPPSESGGSGSSTLVYFAIGAALAVAVVAGSALYARRGPAAR